MIANELKLQTLPILGTSYAIAKLAPEGGKSQLFMLQKTGGQVSPPIQNISPILKVK